MVFVYVTFSRLKRNLLLSFLRHDGKLWRFFLHPCPKSSNFVAEMFCGHGVDSVFIREIRDKKEKSK